MESTSPPQPESSSCSPLLWAIPETQDSIDSTLAFINAMATAHRVTSFQVYPFYLLPNAADDLEYRKLFHLTGRHGVVA